MCIPVPRSDVDVQNAFVTMILPRVQQHARIAFRGVRCPQKKADMIAEAVALAWKWHRRLAARGRDATEFVSAIADFAVRHVRAGRRVAGIVSPNDVLSERAQVEHNFRVEHLPSSVAMSYDRLGTVNGQRHQDAYEERLHDNTMTPPDEQAAFRLDFKAWLKTLTGRERRMVKLMARDERTVDLSKTFELSPGRVSQMRSEFRDGWQRFVGDVPPREALAGTGSAA